MWGSCGALAATRSGLRTGSDPCLEAGSNAHSTDSELP